MSTKKTSTDNENDSLEIESLELEPAPDLKQVQAQKLHWREKAQREKEARLAKEQEITELKTRLEAIENKTKETSSSVEEIKLREEHGLDDADLRILRGLATGAGKQPHEMLEDEAFKEYREVKLSKKRTVEAIPTQSSRTPIVDNKTFSELSPEEQKRNYANTVKTLIDKGKNKNSSFS